MMQPSILPRPGRKSAAAWIASGPSRRADRFLADLSGHALRALPWLFDFWALDHQLPPPGNWRSWVILGGRGAGKTRAGAEWVRSVVEGSTPLGRGRARRLALIGETYDQAREVMIFGDSGILACSPPDRRPRWEATRRRLVWPNGAIAQLHSATEPEALRGPQFDAAWLDEFAKWRRAREAWDMLQFALRLGQHPRQVVTTTPRNVPVLREVLAMKDTVVTRAATEANRANLAKSFLAAVRARYGGTRLGRQELEGELLETVEGALWPPALIERCRTSEAGALGRVVVGVDPPATGHEGSDACGIVVAGAQTEGPHESWRAVVLADRSVKAASPARWVRAAVAAYREFEADMIVAEVNQGGDMVEAVLRQIDPLVPVRKVRARRGKAARAEPVAALYEQGRVTHLPGLEALEAEMERMTLRGFEGGGSPDRVDALVWALWALMIDALAPAAEPRIRLL